MRITNYGEAAEFLARTGDRRAVRGRVATWVMAHARGYAVRYHDTDIVVFRADGAIEVAFGGYHTMACRRRMGEHGVDAVTVGDDISRVTCAAGTVHMHERAVIRPCGDHTTDLPDAAAIRRHRRWRESIRRFAREAARAYIQAGPPAISAAIPCRREILDRTPQAMSAAVRAAVQQYVRARNALPRGGPFGGPADETWLLRLLESDPFRLLRPGSHVERKLARVISQHCVKYYPDAEGSAQ